MKTNAILDLMIKDHGKILALLKKVESSKTKEKDLLKKSFYDFDWNLQKHFFTEERAIFTMYNPEDTTDAFSMIPQLLQEHNEMVNTLKQIETKVNQGEDFEIRDLKKQLINHKNFEEEKVYPRLDQILSDSQRKIIISRISEII
jgi:hemerythrin-like domain-containing protein